MDFLRNEGCLACQGFLHSQPLPASQIAEPLRERQPPVAPGGGCPLSH